MRSLILILLWLAALAAGCSLNVDYTGTYFQCGENDRCPEGFVCRQKVCIPTEPPAATCSQDVASGGEHACSIRDGTVWCWGRNDSGQLGDGTSTDSTLPVQVTGISDAVEVVAGYVHTCVRHSAGNISCWGSNGNGRLGDGGTTDAKQPVAVRVTGAMTALAAGDAHTCALDGAGAVWCWGANGDGQLGDGGMVGRGTPAVVPGVTAAKIAAGDDATCAIDRGGALFCWGENDTNQFGLGEANPMNRSQPTLIPGLTEVESVGIGEAHMCVVAGGAVRCAGGNEYGQLGNGTYTGSPTFVSALVPGRAVQVDVGELHSCVLDSDDHLWCWGSNGEGRLADLSQRNMPWPTLAVVQGGKEVSLGQYHTCVLDRDGAVWCAGHNGRGQLGNGVRTTHGGPQVVSNLPKAVRIAAGGAFTCSLDEAGAARCWGENDNGELGDGSVTPWSNPVPVALGGIEQISAGSDHACAIKAGQVWCWGWNEFGQLGDGTINSHGIPVPVGSITGATQVAAGDRHTCAVDGGNVKCWGRNTEGQLGTGSTAPSTVPAMVLTGASSVAVGTYHSCAVVGGMVQCWGDNQVGQLGTGTTTPSTSPVMVVGITNATQVVARNRTTFALLDDGSVRAWGYGCDGRLGATGQRCASNTMPLPVLISSVRKLVSGYDSTCAIKMDKTLWCWGPNWAGQLGTGTYTTEFQPAQVATLPDVLDVATGGSHGCAVRGDGTVVCWGSDGVNQLGDGIARDEKPTAARLVCD